MKVLNFIVGSLAGAIALWLLGWVVYGMILMDTEFMAMDPDMGWRPGPDIAAIFVGEWMIAMLITLILGYWGNVKTFAGGAFAGGIVGLLLGLGFGFLIYAQRVDIEIDFMLIDTVITIVRLAIGGGIIALVLKAMEPKAPAVEM